jgi:hypothetical protein
MSTFTWCSVCEASEEGEEVEKWSVGVLECWSVGVLERWSVDILRNGAISDGRAFPEVLS